MSKDDRSNNGLPQEALDALVLRMHSGEQEALRQLVETYMYLVDSVAKRYRRRSDFDDLRQEGVLGLVDAAKEYQSDRGPFEAFARWPIRRAMYRAICTSHMILSEHAWRLVVSLEKEARDATQGERTGANAFLHVLSEQPLSLDRPCVEEGTSLADLIEAEERLPFDECIALRDQLERALTALPADQSRVFTLRALRQLKDADIARMCRCSERTVYNRYVRAVRALRTVLMSD